MIYNNYKYRNNWEVHSEKSLTQCNTKQSSIQGCSYLQLQSSINKTTKSLSLSFCINCSDDSQVLSGSFSHMDNNKGVCELDQISGVQGDGNSCHISKFAKYNGKSIIPRRVYTSFRFSRIITRHELSMSACSSMWMNLREPNQTPEAHPMMLFNPSRGIPRKLIDWYWLNFGE